MSPNDIDSECYSSGERLLASSDPQRPHNDYHSPISISVMSTDSNSLAREFLTDVNRLCNAVVQRVETREEEEEETHMATLGQYLVHGRGFLLLTKLNSIIDQHNVYHWEKQVQVPYVIQKSLNPSNLVPIYLCSFLDISPQALTCREELLTLLLSLLPLVWKIPVQEEKAADFNLPLSTDIILTKEKNSSSQRSTQEKLHLEGSAPSSQVSAKVNVFRKSRRQRKITHRYSIRDARKTQLSTSDSEANSDEKGLAVNKHRRPHLLQHFVTSFPKEDHPKAKLDHLVTKEEHTPPDTMASENSRESIPRQASSTDVLSEPAALSVISNMNNSPFDLCHVLLSLLEKVCKFDITLNHNSPLAASVVPTLTEFLAGFGDCCTLSDNLESRVVSAGWTEEPVALIQRMLFRTVLHLMSVDVSTAEMMPENLRKNLTKLLRAALKIRTCLEKQPDPFAPRQKKTLQEVQEDFVFSKYRHRALLLPELLEGVLQILICCLQSAASNPFYFSQAMELVQEFIQHHGFNLFETAVLQMEWLVLRDGVPPEASEHLKALINGVMKIISTVKKVKSEQLHHSMCTRKRHRRCEYSHFMHHHRDLSGLLVSAFKNQVSKNPFEETADGDVYYPERCCCIAVCAHQCLRLLQQASLSSTCVQILSGVHNVGICCCMDPKSVIIPLLHAFKLPALKSFQQHILNILNKLILDQLGGAEVSQKIKKAACNICTVDSDQLAQLEETLQGNLCDAEPSSSLSSPSYRFQGILPSSGSEDLLWKWDALKSYQNFVFEEDRLHSIQIANHICSLIQKGNIVVQWKLYNYIFNPVLQRGVELAHHCQHLSIASAQTHVCRHHNQCLPQDVLQIYTHVLPEIELKTFYDICTIDSVQLAQLEETLKGNSFDTEPSEEVIRDLFLSCDGVNQIIELNYLNGIRSHSLKAFETLIISLGEQQKDASVPGIDGIDIEQKELSSVNVGTSFHHQQAYSDSTQSLSKFYAGLKEAYPKRRKTVNQDVHINTINLFLCVAFLCISKEAESDRESANDSEDTSGYDSTASEPLSHMLPCLSLESLVLPSPEHMHQAADIWSMCRWIYMLSSVFQKQFYRLGGFRVCHKLIFMIIQKLFESHKEEQGKKEEDTNVNENRDLNRISEPEITMQEDLLSLTIKSDPIPSELGTVKKGADSLGKLELQHISSINVEQISATEAAPKEAKIFTDQESETSLQSIRLLEALLAICLHSARTSQQKMELELPNQNLSVENILFEMRDHLSQSKVIETQLAKPLFDALLRVALGNYSADFEHDAVTEKSHQSAEELSSQPGDFSEEAEDSQCCSFKLLVEEEGYEADSESNPEDGETQDDGVDLKSETEGFGTSSSPNDLLENLTQGEIIYPEICMLELNLLSACKAKLDVLAHVFESFLKIIRQKEKNVFLLMQQLLEISSNIVKVNLFSFLASFMSCMPESIGGSSGIFDEFKNMFRRANPSFENISGEISLYTRVSRSKKEADRESFPQRLLSSWHIAPSDRPEGAEYINPGERLIEEGCIHIISLGSKALMIQVWADPHSATFIFRSPKRKRRFMGKSPYGSLDRGGDRVLVTAIYLVKEKYVIEGAKVGSQEAFYLYACGPNHTSIMPCKYGKPANDYSKYINKEILQCEQIRELFMTKKDVDIGVLTYTIYEPVIRLKGQMKTQLSQRPFSSKEVQSILLEPHHLKNLQPTEYKTIQGILHEIGGTGCSFKIDSIWEKHFKALSKDANYSLKKREDEEEHKEGQLTSMPREVCRSFVKIIAEVLGSPPDLELLTIIFNFLLAVHPPTNTYICHNPTNFYFSLHIDDKIFQEKVQSIMYLRHSSSGGRSLMSPGFMVISPSGFTASPYEGENSSNIIPQQMAAHMLRSRSLPAFPTSSLLMQSQKLTGSLGCSIDRLQNIADTYVATQSEKQNSFRSSNTLKKGKEDAFISSCESAKTVCEMEAVLPVQVSVSDIPKGMQGFPVVKVDHKELGAEPRAEDDSPGDESCPRRPDYLKGLASFQRSHSTIASLGLAFPSQNGSAAIGRWPSLVDGNTDDWENFTYSLGYEPNYNRTASAHSVTEDCLVPICCGLYELLSGVLLILPDIMLEDVMDKLIQADTLLVLVNHPSPAIQQGVIKLLDAYFARASKEQKDKFLKNRGFSLLANQLYLHRGTQELLECFIEMFFGRRVGFDEEFDLEDVKNLGLFQKWSVIPILGLIETSLYDNILLHNALLLLLQILNSCSKVADMLLDNGLLYVLCNTVAALNGLEKNIPVSEYKLLACDIQQLFIAVTIHACSSSGTQYFRVIEDLIVMLGYLQNSKNKRTQNMAVALQLRVLQAAMEFIRTTANHDSENLTDSLQSPAPHHTIVQKRKSIAGEY
ncbi:hypothetical protein P7K49_035438 [Saguinus oedipus]|uniref:Lysosomal-trafficking regulator n=1 Tax=Saguinus oedipus TaxID=9490 RepID=A0ABQ9TMM3_SAGOE|nr:hypothetical protein P7K49_035438 [Saguinus oedipus]